MSSISSSTHRPSPLILELEDQKKPRVMNPQDMDGDGVVDGESLSGASGKVENNSDLVALILAQRGLSANQDGNLESVDGFAITPATAPIVMNFDGVPALPEDGGGSQSPIVGGSNRMGHFDWMHGTQGVADAALMWMALSTMAKTSQRDMADMKDFKHAMQLGKAEAKKNEIKSTEEQIEAERAAALNSFMWSVASALMTLAVSKWEALGANQALGSAAGEMVTKFGDYQNKAFGPQAKADEKRIEAMRHQLMQEYMDQGIETAKTSYDEARELFKLSLKILDEHAEREAQITANITRG